ncbi:hypothetical protein [Flavobacterium sp. UMI-01]|uniref:hypothetical protein n=1 Tax=Flavobacterium sp. UMI-01 TaxID=1441053 RepID=UPI001C7E0B46|nr:hypothetical protein [Flavobacterium sp. UMI-01]GIZ07563.1 hypothetical protein FUMI01_02900 [Flavobacterium sp. UMI-01]
MKIKLIVSLTIGILLQSCSEHVVESNNIQEQNLTFSNNEAAKSVATTAITVSGFIDTSTYLNNGFAFLNPSEINKNRQAIGGSSYTEVYGFNVPEENRARGIRWNSDDETTNLWKPQGIAGFTKNGIRYLLVTWYATNDADYKGSRITLIDISPSSTTYLMYRHILLVQPTIPTTVTGYTQYNTFAPLNIHAGGVAYFNDKLYVASTNLGIRVFDLNKIIEVTTGEETTSLCGKHSNGTLYAFNYRYILPQTGYYDINGGANPFSTIQVNAEGTELWTAQYHAGSVDASIVPKIYGFPINSSGTVLNSGIQYVIPKNSLFADNHAHGMQGVFRKGTTTWLSCTGSPSNSYGSNARLARYKDGDTDTVRYRWPYGAEALYYEAQYDYLWSLTEHEPNSGASNGSQVNRCIFAVKFANYE